MDRHLWNQYEFDYSFKKVNAVIEFIQQNFHVDSSVHVGFIYISVGRDAGKTISRYLLVIPYYNPAIHGYNFVVNHPFVFVRGFPGLVSKDFYQYLDDVWIDNADKNETLLECSPLMVAKLDDSLDGGFQVIEWDGNKDRDFLSILSTDINAWIHGPKESNGFGEKIIDFLTTETTGEKSLINQMILDFTTSSCEQEKDKITYELADKIIEILGACISFSFPTFQLEIVSPMIDKVPFHVNPFRMKMSGVIESTDKYENDFNIVVARADYEKKYLNFQRVWNKLHNTNLEKKQKQKLNCLRDQVFNIINGRLN